ncbi:MAG: hypothetical protein HY868_00655 [Chloroflexi bacterium]|nr:hypothetical protein [Chloroflexota bacterium]
MIGIDWVMVLIGLGALLILFLAIDFLFAGGGMSSAMMGTATQCGAAMTLAPHASAGVASPYGWVLIVALVLITLAIFGVLFGYR